MRESLLGQFGAILPQIVINGETLQLPLTSSIARGYRGDELAPAHAPLPGNGTGQHEKRGRRGLSL
jgi:hypothetical protein